MRRFLEGAKEAVRDAEGSRYTEQAGTGQLVQIVHWLEYETEEGSRLRINPRWEQATHEMKNGGIVKR